LKEKVKRDRTKGQPSNRNERETSAKDTEQHPKKERNPGGRIGKTKKSPKKKSEEKRNRRSAKGNRKDPAKTLKSDRKTDTEPEKGKVYRKGGEVKEGEV